MFRKDKREERVAEKEHQQQLDEEHDQWAAWKERSDANFELRKSIEKGGGTNASAVVTAVAMEVESKYNFDPDQYPHGDQQLRVEADVDDGAGSTFPATLDLFLGRYGAEKPPQAGHTIWLMFDPKDRSRIAPAWDWKAHEKAGGKPRAGDKKGDKKGEKQRRRTVPHICPNCGAPVDQLAESVSEHPMCHMCRQPLPVG